MFNIQYIINNISLSWSEIQYCLRQSFLGSDEVIYIAKTYYGVKDSSPLVLDLVLIQDNEWFKVLPIVEELAKHEEFNEGIFYEKWVYLTLLWIYENREKIADPIEEIQNIYYLHLGISNIETWPFNYKNWYVEGASKEENTNTIYRNWKYYLQEKSLIYKPK
jgi:hypothetical protein